MVKGMMVEFHFAEDWFEIFKANAQQSAFLSHTKEQQRILTTLLQFVAQHNENQQKQFDAAQEQIQALQSNNQQLAAQLNLIQTALREASRLQQLMSESVTVQLPAGVDAMSRHENELSVQTTK